MHFIHQRGAAIRVRFPVVLALPVSATKKIGAIVQPFKRFVTPVDDGQRIRTGDSDI